MVDNCQNILSLQRISDQKTFSFLFNIKFEHFHFNISSIKDSETHSTFGKSASSFCSRAREYCSFEQLITTDYREKSLLFQSTAKIQRRSSKVNSFRYRSVELSTILDVDDIVDCYFDRMINHRDDSIDLVQLSDHFHLQ